MVTSQNGSKNIMFQNIDLEMIVVNNGTDYE